MELCMLGMGLTASFRSRIDKDHTHAPARRTTSSLKGEVRLPESSAKSGAELRDLFKVRHPNIASCLSHAEDETVPGDRQTNSADLLKGHERSSRLVEMIDRKCL